MTSDAPDWNRSVGTSQEGEALTVLAQAPIWWFDLFSSPTCLWTEQVGTVNLVVGSPEATSNASRIRSGTASLSVFAASGSSGTTFIFLPAMPNDAYAAIAFDFMIDLNTNYKDQANSLIFRFDNNTQIRQSSIRVSYNPIDYKWYVSTDGGGSWTLVGTYRIADDNWAYVKVFFDMVNFKYIKLQVNEKVWDISTLGYFNDVLATTAAHYSLPHIQANSASGKQAQVFIDDVVITYNET